MFSGGFPPLAQETAPYPTEKNNRCPTIPDKTLTNERLLVHQSVQITIGISIDKIMRCHLMSGFDL